MLIRNVPKRTVDALRARARRRGSSLQAEALAALERASAPAGDTLGQWLETVKEPGLEARFGIAGIRNARAER